MVDSKAYKEYYTVASGAKPLKAKTKYKKKADELVTPSKSKTTPASKGSRLKSPAKVAKTDKKKQPAMMPKTKGLAVLGSGDGAETQLEVPYEQQQKVSGIDEGAGDKPEVPDLPKYDSESDEESWTFSQDEEDADEETDDNDDSEGTESDNDRDDLTHPNLSTYKEDDEEEEKEKANDEEMSSDQRVSTPPEYELTLEEEENKEGDDKNMDGDEEQDEEDDLYRDVNINLERSDAEMTDAQANKEMEDAHVTLTAVPPVVQQQSSSVSSDLVSKFTNPTPDTVQEKNQFVKVVSSIPSIVDNYLASKMKEEVNMVIQLQTNKLREEAQADNQEFLNQVDSTMKKIIKEQVQAQVSKIMPKIKKYVTESLGAEVLVRSANQPQTSYAVAASLSEFELKKILIDKMESNKSIDRLDIQKNLYNALDEDLSAGSNRGLKRRRSGKEAELSKEPTHKEFKSRSSSKGASKSQPKLSNKSAQAEEHGQKVDDFQKYTTSVTKRKAADYGHVKWIEDKVSRIWSLKFDGYATNMESSKDVYSRHMIIVVISLKIIKYFGYIHLEEIIVRRQDGKMSNLNIEERYALNVALRMFTHRIVIQERVEDL
ncbi:hypothetical protein Tco_0158197 [Tanacetum coccineum]